MGREKDCFRDNIELMNRRFPNKDMLNIKDVMTFTGKNRDTVKKHIRFNTMGLVSKADLSRQISL